MCEKWHLIVPDMLQLYGVDMADRELLRVRPWSWLVALFDGLRTTRSRVLWDEMSSRDQENTCKAMDQGANPRPWL